MGALNLLSPDYFCNIEDLSDTHSILYCAAVAVCLVVGVKIVEKVTIQPKYTVPALQYRI